MGSPPNDPEQIPFAHSWLRHVDISYVPGDSPSELAEKFVLQLLDSFRLLGHTIQESPDYQTDILLSTAPFGVPVPWRESILLTGRMRFKLAHQPTVFTLIHARPDELQRSLDLFAELLSKDRLEPADYEFPGMAQNAYHVLWEQGRRGGPILALERLLQAQSKSINILLLVGEHEPERLYHFDLVGAYPQSQAAGAAAFYQDIVLRMVTRVSTHEITEHQAVGEPISIETWKTLETPQAMCRASKELDRRGFFTEMVRIQDLVHVPSVSRAVAEQYSEGCFATWEPEIPGLIVTITGSARPVNKGEITQDDLAVIAGVRPDRRGALIRQVDGMANFPPSSEAVEMIDMDDSLPWITLNSGERVPVVRSKLHGHRGVSAYNPRLVEFVPLEPAYYHFPVTCATEAQAQGIRQAFARSQALRDRADPRQVVFTILPTHGVVIAEKWAPEKAPFQLIWEYFDAGYLELANHVPQGPVEYLPDSDRLVLKGL